ncbi:hypothetical protein NDU88_007595 [Pleurodeles waltl]|uniref:Uncharacterized protein n=1 Tax=Pleurodeles waltl TaxID=8319 RepID=A0AAV7RSV3_PLEWA|nr:hypothetical protein NDU88_007595 [Pleurodeles waltl]
MTDGGSLWFIGVCCGKDSDFWLAGARVRRGRSLLSGRARRIRVIFAFASARALARKSGALRSAGPSGREPAGSVPLLRWSRRHPRAGAVFRVRGAWGRYAQAGSHLL